MKPSFCVTAGLLLFLLTVSAHAQDVMKIKKLTGTITLDGIVDESAWDSIEPLPMTMHRPVFNSLPTDPTEVRIGYTDNFIYVSGKLYDSEPDRIMSTSKQRDEQSMGNDYFTVLFDSFNDKENALGFSTNPLGLRRDFSVQRDAISTGMDRPVNFSWNTFWDVATTRNNEGWFVEMRIPMSSLRFKDNNGEVEMGLIVQRSIPHRNEMLVFPAIPPNWGPFSASRPSQAREIMLEGVHADKPLYIAPYISGGMQQDYLINNERTGFERNDNPRLNGGVDLKFGLTNNITADVTINTDFAQVEADNEQINLSRFSLFFPEKRTFFQERSSIFSFGVGGRNDLFYSRTIGLYRGNEVPIYAGVRVTGMAGKWDIGILDMQTRPFNSPTDFIPDLPSENFAVMRLRRNVINANSYLGGIVTSRTGFDGTYNAAYGIDGIFRLFGNDYLNVKVSQVMDDASANKMLSLDPTNIYLNWNRFNDQGLGYNFHYIRSGKDFRPEMGFMNRYNFAHYSGTLQYGWLPGQKSRFFSTQLSLSGDIYSDLSTGETQSSDITLDYDMQTKKQLFTSMGLTLNQENLPDTFSLSDNAAIPAGNYSFLDGNIRINTPGSRRLSARLGFNGGQYYDGFRASFTPSITWNASPTFQFGLNYSFNKVSLPERKQSFTGQVAGLNSLVMFNTKMTLSTFIQYNSADKRLTTNIRFRYNPREGNDFYIVFNEGRNMENGLPEPGLPNVNNRLLLLKYTYTFVL